MRYTKVALPIIVSVLFFLVGCAHLTPEGSQIAVLHVAECME